jgi:phage terminase large subunit-like protein
MITTTPRPLKLLKEIMARSDTAITRGSTHDNRANLAPAFFAEVIRRYDGTRVGRQEIDAEILDDIPGAL